VTHDRDRSALLVIVGTLAGWLGASDVSLNYVRPAARPLVVIGGVVLCGLGLLPPMGLLARRRPRTATADAATAHHSAHTHSGLGVGWLLIVPAVLLTVVPPSPLGANAVRSRLVRSTGDRATDLPVGRPVGGAVPMPMVEFWSRAAVGDAQLLYDVPVRFVGFVSDESDGGGYRLSKFVIFCCAADAEAVEIAVRGDSTARRKNQWLRVEGVLSPPAPGASRTPPTLVASSVVEVGRPRPPYEYTTIWTN
jgi:uncharacterized repeat protein (TIGR03943 family)